MWARLDDELIDHLKVFAAGKRIGANGPAIALGFYAVGLMWANKHLTDGFLPKTTVESFRHVKDPLAVADALVSAGLFDAVAGGFSIHDFKEYNPSAKVIKTKRKEDRLRKQRERAAANGRA
jgi:hypothetical protein